MFFQAQSKNNVSILELRRLAGISYRAAWRIKHKMMQAMFEREQTTVLLDRVEIDDNRFPAVGTCHLDHDPTLCPPCTKPPAKCC